MCYEYAIQVNHVEMVLHNGVFERYLFDEKESDLRIKSFYIYVNNNYSTNKLRESGTKLYSSGFSYHISSYLAIPISMYIICFLLLKNHYR